MSSSASETRNVEPLTLHRRAALVSSWFNIRAPSARQYESWGRATPACCSTPRRKHSAHNPGRRLSVGNPHTPRSSAAIAAADSSSPCAWHAGFRDGATAVASLADAGARVPGPQFKAASASNFGPRCYDPVEEIAVQRRPLLSQAAVREAERSSGATATSHLRDRYYQ